VKGDLKSAKLNTGAVIPLVGLGTWKAEQGEVGKAVTLALEAGYRHMDCASVYGNEKEIGAALKAVFDKGKIKREEVFITSRLWNTEHARDNVLPALKQTLADLQLSYLDLYLVHWPVAFEKTGEVVPKDKSGGIVWAKTSIQETWQAMEELPKTGLVKAIGVSNFHIINLLDLLTYAKIKPAANQIEMQPYLYKPELLGLCAKHGIHVTAYSPFGSSEAGQHGPLHDHTLGHIAKQHKKTVAQVIVRWSTQHGVSVIPKSVKPARMQENLDVFGFALSDKEIEQIDKLNKDRSFCNMKDYWGFAVHE